MNAYTFVATGITADDLNVGFGDFKNFTEEFHQSLIGLAVHRRRFNADF